jgi:hypothetical protein
MAAKWVAAARNEPALRAFAVAIEYGKHCVVRL